MRKLRPKWKSRLWGTEKDPLMGCNPELKDSSPCEEAHLTQRIPWWVLESRGSLWTGCTVDASQEQSQTEKEASVF